MTHWVLRLLIANIVMFLVAAPGTPLFQLLMFVPAWVLQRPWTPLTYMFLHANMAHILFNMLGLYFFGPRVEVRIGSRDFILLYLAAGLAGALLSFFFESVPIVGASGAIFGVLLAFAHFWPDERIYLWFILPVPARLMVIGFTFLSLYSGLSGAGGGVAHFAHLGGFVGSWIYLRDRQRRATAFRRMATPEAEQSALDRLSGRNAREEKRWDEIDVARLHEINRTEVERIREKVREKGSGSLTADERAFMNRMLG